MRERPVLAVFAQIGHRFEILDPGTLNHRLFAALILDRDHRRSRYVVFQQGVDRTIENTQVMIVLHAQDGLPGLAHATGQPAPLSDLTVERMPRGVAPADDRIRRQRLGGAEPLHHPEVVTIVTVYPVIAHVICLPDNSAIQRLPVDLGQCRIGPLRLEETHIAHRLQLTGIAASDNLAAGVQQHAHIIIPDHRHFIQQGDLPLQLTGLVFRFEINVAVFLILANEVIDKLV